MKKEHSILQEANTAISALSDLKNKLHNKIYTWHEDIQGGGHYYNTGENTLDSETLESILHLLIDLSDISSKIYDELETISESNGLLFEKANSHYEKIQSLVSLYENLAYSDPVYNLSHFNLKENANDILQNEYASEADEDNLDKYIEKSLDEALEKLNELCEEAEEPLKSIDKLLTDFINETKEFLGLFQKQILVKINKWVNIKLKKLSY